MPDPQMAIKEGGSPDREEAAMREPTLNRLLGALDSLVDGACDEALAADVDVAAARLRCIEGRLGSAAAESPYLHFLRRIVASGAGGGRLAASA